MADQKVSDLVLADSPLGADDLIYVVQSATSKKAPVRALRPQLPGCIVGGYYDQVNASALGGTGGNATNLATGTNRFDLFPFAPRQTFRIEEIGVDNVTSAASLNLKLCLYASGDDGLPSSLIWEGADISLASTGYQSQARDYTFERGQLYWFGVRQSGGGGSIRSAALANCPAIGLTGNNPSSTTYGTVLRTTLTYADPAPGTYTADAANFINSNVNLVRFLVRSLT